MPYERLTQCSMFTTHGEQRTTLIINNGYKMFPSQSCSNSRTWKNVPYAHVMLCSLTLHSSGRSPIRLLGTVSPLKLTQILITVLLSCQYITSIYLWKQNTDDMLSHSQNIFSKLPVSDNVSCFCFQPCHYVVASTRKCPGWEYSFLAWGVVRRGRGLWCESL